MTKIKSILLLKQTFRDAFKNLRFKNLKLFTVTMLTRITVTDKLLQEP